MLVLAGVARLLVGIDPRLGTLAWLPLLLAVVVMFFGDLLQLPQWLQDLSPFEHLALVPAEDFAWAPFLVLALLAARDQRRRTGRVRAPRHPLSGAVPLSG